MPKHLTSKESRYKNKARRAKRPAQDAHEVDARATLDVLPVPSGGHDRTLSGVVSARETSGTNTGKSTFIQASVELDFSDYCLKIAAYYPVLRSSDGKLVQERAIMRICIDARALSPVMNGLGRYSLNLVREIARLDQQNDYVVLRRAAYRETLVVQQNFTEIPVSCDISSAQNVLAGAAVLNPLKVDVYHSLNHFLPLGARAGRVIVTLHDLIWVNDVAISYDALWRRSLVGGLVAPFIGRALRAADHVITVSQSTRQAALTRYGLPRNKFTVIHHGVDHAFLSAASPASLPDLCKGKRFIFSLGSSKPFKNVSRLIQAFAATLPHHPDLYLVVAGRGDGYPSLERLTRELGLAERVVFTGPLSDSEVRACFGEALLFAFPSLVEGFGLPPIEAMASGCPVVCSNVASLLEVAGEAALFVDPLDPRSIASGLLRLVEDERLREALVRKGHERASEFTWRACARKTLAIYGDELAAREP